MALKMWYKRFSEEILVTINNLKQFSKLLTKLMWSESTKITVVIVNSFF